MKYLALLKKYIWVFIGAVLFGLTAVKVKSAGRSEKKASDRVRVLSEDAINAKSDDIQKAKDDLTASQEKVREVKDNGFARLDRISDSSSTVKSLLDDYNRHRV